MKLNPVIPFVAVLAALVSCQRAQEGPRTAVSLVYEIAADSSGRARLAAQAGRRGGEGSIAVIGEPESAIVLARRLVSSDRVDNIDGTPRRDYLPDFAGETFDVIMDAVNAPYSHFWASARQLPDSLRAPVLDSLREAAVLNAVCAWDSLSWRSATDAKPLLRKQRSKLVILTSSLQARWGLFDVDTLQQMCGGACQVLSPVPVLLEEAYAAGARRLLVWTSRDVRESGVWESVFAQKAYPDARLRVITPESALDVRTELRNLLREYQESGEGLDALLLDSYTLPTGPLHSELDIIRQEGREEDAAFQAMLSPIFRIWDPASALVEVTYRTLRERHLLTHQIARPAACYYETAESRDGWSILVETSAQYAQRTYVPDLD